jgi:hypothetical protein
LFIINKCRQKKQQTLLIRPLKAWKEPGGISAIPRTLAAAGFHVDPGAPVVPGLLFGCECRPRGGRSAWAMNGMSHPADASVTAVLRNCTEIFETATPRIGQAEIFLII